VKIDGEFEKLIDPLSDEEFAGLERKILQEGFKGSVIVWKEQDILIDGHNRVAICEKHSIEYAKRYISLPDRNAAINWIIDNQLSRRNLSPNQMSYLRGKKYLAEKKAVGRPVSAIKTPVVEKDKVPTVGTLLPKKTSHKIAKKTGVSHQTIERDGQYAEAVDKISDKLDSNKVKTEPRKDVIALAKKPAEEQERIIDIVKEENIPVKEAITKAKKKEVIEKLNSIETIEVKKTEGVFDVIVIDPPWPMKKIGRDCRPNQVEFDYSVITIDEIKELGIPCADDCHVWLWTTQKFLPVAFECLEAWNLKYVCTFVWHKPGGFQVVNLPQYNAEFVLYARRGAPTLTTTKAFSTCFYAPRGKHSEKPTEFYDMVRRVTAGRRLDMFNRRVIEGFLTWGNEAV